jgi:predicted TIM-barrel fold metal-dependent hydrolase
MRSDLFDAHLHIIDARFPLVPNQGYVPPPYPVERYLADAAPLGITGGAVVSGSFQAFDQSYLLAALARLGPDFVGVTQLPATVADAEVLALDAAGVRAVRFNLHRGGSVGVAEMATLASRVWELAGWHAELYVDAAELPSLTPALASLPRVVIDHLGLTAAGLPHLLALVERGAWVKATGFGRVDLDIPAALRAIARANPGALLFGTDLPSTRAPRAFESADVALMVNALDNAELVAAALGGNARALYRPASQFAKLS